MNLRKLFGKKLKQNIMVGTPVNEIGTWAFSFYWDNIEKVDSDFEDILLTLNKMELGPDFSFTYEELEQIANDLIAGKEINL